MSAFDLILGAFAVLGFLSLLALFCLWFLWVWEDWQHQDTSVYDHEAQDLGPFFGLDGGWRRR